MNFNNWKEQTIIQQSSQDILELERRQEVICKFFRELITQESPYLVLQKFDQLFMDYRPKELPKEISEAMQYILKNNAESIFFSTLKECCYIIVEPLIKAKKYLEINNLIQVFNDPTSEVESNHSFISTGNLITRKLQSWINKFIQSSSYQELKFLTYQVEPLIPSHWTHRYLEYLFYNQYIDNNNSQKQRDVATIMVLRIKKEFKFNLAMFFTKSQFGERNTTNPTILNENILRFIKLIAVRKGNLSYRNLANIFLQQTKDLTYLKFHLAFIKYLVFSISDQKTIPIIETKLANKLQELYQGNNDKKLNDAFLLRTCNKCFDLLLANNGKPSELFVLFMLKTNPYTIVILLLKIILISPNSRSHLDKKIAELVRYYQIYPENECKWFINFLEVYRTTFAIYADTDVEFNLVKVKETSTQGNLPSDLDSYQFFVKYNKKKK